MPKCTCLELCAIYVLRNYLQIYLLTRILYVEAWQRHALYYLYKLALTLYATL